MIIRSGRYFLDNGVLENRLFFYKYFENYLSKIAFSHNFWMKTFPD
jgi:hypothetical protein